MVGINRIIKRAAIALLCLCVAPIVFSNDIEKVKKTVKAAELITLKDLQHINEVSKTNCVPVVIMVSQFSCAYCDKLKKYVFTPIIRSGEYTEKAIFRELLVDPNEVIVDENGKEILGEKFAGRYIENMLTPTVLFLDPYGKELAERIIGIGNIDFYGSYFEQSLADVNAKMQSQCHQTLSYDESALSKRKVN